MCYKYIWIIQFYLESGAAQLILDHFAFDSFVLLPNTNMRTPYPSLVAFLNKTMEKKPSSSLSVRNAQTADLKHTNIFKIVRTLWKKMDSTILFYLSFH